MATSWFWVPKNTCWWCNQWDMHHKLLWWWSPNCLPSYVVFFSISQQQLFEKISDWTLVFRLSKKNEKIIHVSLRIPIRYNLYKWVISGVISPLYSGIPMGMNPWTSFVCISRLKYMFHDTWKPLDDGKKLWHLPKCRPFHRSGLVLLSGKLWLPGSRRRQNSIRKRHGGKATAKVGFSRWSFFGCGFIVFKCSEI